MPPLFLSLDSLLRAARRSRRRAWLASDLIAEVDVIQRILGWLIEDQHHALQNRTHRDWRESLGRILKAQPIGRPICGAAARGRPRRVIRATDEREAGSSIQRPGDIEARSAAVSRIRARAVVLHVVTQRVARQHHYAFQAIEDGAGRYVSIDRHILFQTQTELRIGIGVLKSDAVSPVGDGATGFIGIEFERPRSGKVRALSERHA